MVKSFLRRAQSKRASLYSLHILNDGFEASFLLLLPFLASDLKLDFLQVGTLGALANIFTILVALASSVLIAKIGGLKVLLCALVVYAIGFLGVGFADGFAMLVIMFSLGGLGFGIFHPVAFSLVAAWSTAKTRGAAMGAFTAAGEVGKTALPGLLSVLAVYIGWRFSAMLYALVALVVAFGLSFIIRRHSNAAEQVSSGTITQVSWRIVMNKYFIAAGSAHFFDAIASASLFVFLPFLLLERGIAPVWLGALVAVFFVGSFVGKIYFGKLVDRFGSGLVFMLMEISMVLIILLLVHSTWQPLIVILAALLGICTKGTSPVVQTMISQSAERHGNFQKAFSVDAFMTGFAITLAPLLLGLISSVYGVTAAFYGLALAACFAMLPVVLIRRRQLAN